MGYYYGPFKELPPQLEEQAKELKTLLGMKDRLRPEDVEKAANSLDKAAEALKKLMRGELPGCMCHTVENDNYSYLDYNPECRHHRSLWSQREESKKRFDEAHTKLKNETRLKLVSELIGGLARGDGQAAQHLVKRAIELADEAMAQLVGASK